MTQNTPTGQQRKPMIDHDPAWRRHLAAALHSDLLPIDPSPSALEQAEVQSRAESESPQIASTLRDVVPDDLVLLQTTGLAHDHVQVRGRALLLRIPKQSQLRLGALDNLLYQAACFQRMQASGRTPRCHAIARPSERLPMGCLLVDEIDGRALDLPADMNAAAEALASIHAVTLPAVTDRPPLINQTEPLAATFVEVIAQAEYLPQASCSEASKRAIGQQLQCAERELATLSEPPARLISFDAHPGNFLIDTEGRAILVDVEKGRYGGAGFDLAHASLYTSTTWDIHSHCVLSGEQVASFYQAWRDAMPPAIVSTLEPSLWPMRRLMWLWSLTWCAKWTVLSRAAEKLQKHDASDTEDWSSDLSSDALTRHVAERVAHYLDADTIAMMSAEFD